MLQNDRGIKVMISIFRVIGKILVQGTFSIQITLKCLRISRGMADIGLKLDNAFSIEHKYSSNLVVKSVCPILTAHPSFYESLSSI